jgi:hypothetical protein
MVDSLQVYQHNLGIARCLTILYVYDVSVGVAGSIKISRQCTNT